MIEWPATTLIDGPDGPLEVHVMGEGAAVVMIPSLGRGASDFEQLAAHLAASGFRVISPEPRGFGRSNSELDGLSMADLADDVAAVIQWAGNERATVVGHAFGNRVARMTATRHPDLVESVVLLACGGRIPPSAEAAAALRAVFDDELSDEEHLAAVRSAFFAPGNDASVWFDGWNGVVAAAQSAATRDTPVDTWWTAGTADVLVVQPADDVIAVAENGRHIVDAVGARGSMVTIVGAGHALLPEQPDAVALTLRTWLHNRGSRAQGMSPPAADSGVLAGQSATITEAAARWADRLERWAIPQEILAQAPTSPWRHDTAMFAVDDTLDRNTLAAEIARAVLPASGGSVLDVGCGGGRAAISLVPPAERVIGVDQSPAMLAEFMRAAEMAGAPSMTVEGRWPDVAHCTPIADVVVCHHVAYNVADIEPFLLELTARARLAVVLVLPPRHPLSGWNDAWRHFWGLERPTEPTADDLAEILTGLGLDAERWDVPRPPLARATTDSASRVESARRRLCLTEDRDDELAAYLDAHEPQWHDTNVVFRWPGSAGDD